MARLPYRLSLLPLVLLFACSSSSSSPSPSQGFNLRVNLTDAPMMQMQAVNVTVTTVRIHQSADAAPDAAGWRDIPVTAAMPANLMAMTGGVLFELCTTNLEPGAYQQVRLIMMPNAGSQPPFQNSVMTMDGVTHPMTVPSDSGKIVHPFAVAAGTTTDLTLDFNAAQSVMQTGSGSWMMQPVISASSTMMPM